MKLLVVRHLNGIKPAYDSDKDIFNKMPLNDIFEIEYTKRRNVRFHRKFFSLLKLAYENQSDYRIMEDMRRDLLIASGFYDESVNRITGEINNFAKSINFSSMDDLQFNEVYNSVKGTICKWIGVTNEMVEEQIEQYY